MITEIWTGEVDSGVLEAYWKEYLQDPEVLKIRCTLVDIRQARIRFNAHPCPSWVGNIVFPVLYDKNLKWKTAIVVGNTAQFKASREYHALAKHYSDDAIFDTVEPARAWLLGPKSPRRFDASPAGTPYPGARLASESCNAIIIRT